MEQPGSFNNTSWLILTYIKTIPGYHRGIQKEGALNAYSLVLMLHFKLPLTQLQSMLIVELTLIVEDTDNYR